MHRALGLSRDPFAPVADPELFWESRERTACRMAALEEIRAGGGVWIRGPAGSGKRSILERIAEELALEGRRVLWVDGESADSGDAFLSSLLGALDLAGSSQERLSAAEALYGRLLEAFVDAGPSIIVFGAGRFADEALEEARILAGLRVAGAALVRLALSGPGPAPFPGVRELGLRPITREDLEACLLHRVAACGAPDLLPPHELAWIAERANGIGDAVEQARRAVCREVFRRAAPAGKPRETASLFDRTEVDEVGQLLDALSPKG